MRGLATTSLPLVNHGCSHTCNRLTDGLSLLLTYLGFSMDLLELLRILLRERLQLRLPHQVGPEA